MQEVPRKHIHIELQPQPQLPDLNIAQVKPTLRMLLCCACRSGPLLMETGQALLAAVHDRIEAADCKLEAIR